ncbi:MAG: hypothetical protein WBL88_10450 [Nitrososphaeraceae archaeon]
MPGKMVVIEQLRGMKRWKKKHGYGMGWIALTSFSGFRKFLNKVDKF